ncbi:hypothetical protein JCM33374_g87 [Metschnikowia sp. JCM 33374]|nr:hypothetical protein JCM33374_g87 [Metschnikowia sp. JCM 33374]
MHEYSFGPGRRSNHTSKRQLSLSRREVSFEPQKKKSNKHKHKASQAPSSRSSSVSILTSSRSGTANGDSPVRVSSHGQFSKTLNSISSSNFYEKPKSLLEKQYEKNLQKFVPVETSDDFLPLESDSAILDSPGKKDNFHSEAANSTSADLKISGSVRKDLKEELKEEPKIEFSEILLDKAKEKEFHVTYFVYASEEFMKKAHSLVLGSNDIGGARVYYSLVKSAIKALHILISEYASYLNPVLESVIYHKLGTIYLKETQALDKAEHFINMAISLASKHNLTQLKVINEFLYCEILEQMNSHALSSFFTEKQQYYRKEGYENIANLYSLMRMNHLLLGDASLGLTALNALSLNKEAHPHIRSLSLLYEASAYLYRGSLSLAKRSIESAQDLIFKASSPPQLVAVSHLTQLASCVQENDSISGKVAVTKLSEFISLQREADWAGWRDDGIFSLCVPLFEGKHEASHFEVQWLNSDEFIILFYFLNGMLDILDHSSWERTKKVFMSCLEIINIQLSQLTTIDTESRNFRISFLTDKIVRLSFIRYSVIYYKIWLEFSHESNFSGIASVQYFINCFDGENFTKEEMCYYKLLVPKFLYLAAVYFHSQGDLNSAKYYFLRIKKMSSQPGDLDSSKISSLQKSLGIGCEAFLPKSGDNELFLFSTLHLVLIAEHDLSILSKTKPIDDLTKSKIIACHGQLSDLLSELNEMLDKEIDTNNNDRFEKSAVFYLSYRAVLLAHSIENSQNGKTVHLSEHVAKLESLISHGPSFGYIKTLSCYMLYKYSTNLEKSTQMLRQVVSNMVDSDENTRFLGQLILCDEDAISLANGTMNFHKVEKEIISIKSAFEKRLEFARLSVQL